MPRVIFKCPYLKGGGKTEAHRRYFVKYIATREGVDKIDDSRKLLPETIKQRKLVSQLLREFPDTKDLFEYEDYSKNPTRENASEFIAAALEHNLHMVARREKYIDYIATRPRAERMGEHGLFTAAGVTVTLSQVAEDVAAHTGNVWTPIISMRREDAVRLGYDNAECWRDFLSSYKNDFANGLKIAPDNLRWYAAYHDEGHHPHVHMICYSTNPTEGFLTKQGIQNIRGGLTKQIFRQDNLSIYQQETEYRSELTNAAQNAMSDLIRQMQNGVLYNEKIEQLTVELVRRLQYHSGQKKYGYLRPPLKNIVDKIVDELEKDSRIAETYRLWCEMRLEILRAYSNNPPHPGKLSGQKELKRIKNIVVEEAARICDQELTFEQPERDGEVFSSDPQDVDADTDLPDFDTEAVADDEAITEPEDIIPHMSWSDQYRKAKEYLYGSDSVLRDFDRAFELFLVESNSGNALAMYDLARMYADGLGREPDQGATQEWYTKALAAFHTVEAEKPYHYVEYRIGKMYAAGLGCEQDYNKAAEWLRMSADEGNKYAQYSLAGLYYRGQGVAQEYERALVLYQDSAAKGFPYASYELGKMYRDGIGTITDKDKSAYHFNTAFSGFRSLENKSHDDKLQYRLGWMLENGVGADQSIPAAMEYYEKAAGVGNPHAQYALAKLLQRDKETSPERIAEAVELLKKAVKSGNGAAVYALAKLYRDGTGVEKDAIQAAELFERAAMEFDNAYAAYALGKMKLEGTAITKDSTAAVQWFEVSAQMGNQYAQYRLGKLFVQGVEVPRNVDDGIKWLSESAKQNNPYAQYSLAMLYLRGELIPKDAAKAAALLEQAAEQDNEYVAYQLGKLYISGEGVQKDTVKAVVWFLRSAKLGNQYAQYALGKLYLMGKDIPRDEEAAMHWFTLSAAQGNVYAQFFLDHAGCWNEPSAFLMASRLMYQMSRIFQDNQPRPASASGGIALDRKLLRKLQAKKIAQGHAEDDHEQSHTMQM